MGAKKLETVFDRLQENLFLEPAVAKIADALCLLASAPHIREMSPQVCEAHEKYLSMKNVEDVIEKECALLELYLRLHSLGWTYTDDEEKALTGILGNRNLPGGLAPLVLASGFIHADTISVDLGAGNGLQGLLMQYVYPHRRTAQIELSSSLVCTGQLLQQTLGIARDRVLWVQGDIRQTDFTDADFVYLYRPVRPYGEGNALYRFIAERLRSIQRPVVVMSVADCLDRFLDGRFTTIFQNEHIAVFSGGVNP